MIQDIVLPELGENIVSGDVTQILVHVGDSIDIEQSLIEVETDKAAIEVPSPFAGVIKEILIEKGAVASVGSVIARIETNVVELKSKNKKLKVPTEVAIQDIVVPELGENIESSDVIAVLISPGDQVAKEQPLIEVETEKAAIEIPSPYDGKITEVLMKKGDQAKVGAIIAKISATATIAETAKPQQTSDSHQPAAPLPLKSETALNLVPHLIPASPAMRRKARVMGIDIRQVIGSGYGGRIQMPDLAAGGSVGAVKLPDFSKWGDVRREPMTKVRKVTAEHLSTTWSTTPQVTHFDKADITDIEKKRKSQKEVATKRGGSLTITAILTKICADALQEFPQFNASVDMSTREVVYKDYFNVGIAVETDRGLLVPVIQNVQKKTVMDLAVDLTEVSGKAREKKLKPDDMHGGCFTISNLGGIGGTGFSPIINGPEVAILGVSRSRLEATWQDDSWQPKLMMPISLSYDHRLIDGADAARFCQYVVKRLEDPSSVDFS